MKMHPLNTIKAIGMIAVVIVGIGFLATRSANLAIAGPNDNAHYFLWSDMPNGSDQVVTPANATGGRGLGWISLNSSDAGAGGNYGVNLNMSSGQMTGYAWSEYGGWLSFAPAGPYPVGPGTSSGGVSIDPICLGGPAPSCAVRGWARFTVGTSPQAGGWDGWVSLRGTGYGVTLDKIDGQLAGWAWGGAVAGWIKFDGAYIDIPPIATPPQNATCTTVTGQVMTYTSGTTPPTACTTLYCYNSTGQQFSYPANQSMPSQCNTDVDPDGDPEDPKDPDRDLCENIVGTQSVLPTFFQGVWYNDPNGDKDCTKMPNPPIMGCTNPSATNYNPQAEIDDGSCVFNGGGGGTGLPVDPIYKEN